MKKMMKKLCSLMLALTLLTALAGGISAMAAETVDDTVSTDPALLFGKWNMGDGTMYAEITEDGRLIFMLNGELYSEDTYVLSDNTISTSAKTNYWKVEGNGEILTLYDDTGSTFLTRRHEDPALLTGLWEVSIAEMAKQFGVTEADVKARYGEDVTFICEFTEDGRMISKVNSSSYEETEEQAFTAEGDTVRFANENVVYWSIVFDVLTIYDADHALSITRIPAEP